MNNEVIYKIPKWGIGLLVLIITAMSIGCVALGVTYDKWGSEDPKWFKYFFYTVAVIAALTAYRLFSWGEYIFFKANSSGLYVSCPYLKKCENKFLFIPWTDVRDIKLGEFHVNGNLSTGVSIDVRISPENRSEYFPELSLMPFTEWTTVGFTDIFLNKEKTVLELNQIKSKNEGKSFDEYKHELQFNKIYKNRKKRSKANLKLFFSIATIMAGWTFLFVKVFEISVIIYMVGIVLILLSPLIYIIARR